MLTANCCRPSLESFHRQAIQALESIQRILRKEQASTSFADDWSGQAEEWKYVSRVADRTLFITFSILCVAFNLAILTASPYTENFSFCPFDNELACLDKGMEEVIYMQQQASHLHQSEQQVVELNLEDDPSSSASAAQEHGAAFLRDIDGLEEDTNNNATAEELSASTNLEPNQFREKLNDQARMHGIAGNGRSEPFSKGNEEEEEDTRIFMDFTGEFHTAAQLAHKPPKRRNIWDRSYNFHNLMTNS